MEPVTLKCTSCGGMLEFDGSMQFGFCKYCGTKVMIPKPNTGGPGTVISESTKIFLLLYYKGEQTQHAIKDEVKLSLEYRNNATNADPFPMGLKIFSGLVEIPNKCKLSAECGKGDIQISGIGSNLTMSKEQKVKVNINGVEMTSNNTRIYYGDLISIGSVIFRIQPMAVPGASETIKPWREYHFVTQ